MFRETGSWPGVKARPRAEADEAWSQQKGKKERKRRRRVAKEKKQEQNRDEEEEDEDEDEDDLEDDYRMLKKIKKGKVGLSKGRPLNAPFIFSWHLNKWWPLELRMNAPSC